MVKDCSSIRDCVAMLKVSDEYQTKKLDEIHKVLVGNGQPGMIAEWNQWKGAVRFFGVLTGIALTILSTAVGVLAYIK